MPKEFKTNMISAAAEKAQHICSASEDVSAWQSVVSKGGASSIAERPLVWLVFGGLLT